MILRPFRRIAQSRTIAALYGMIVAQARSAAFYASYGVPDTVEGRFDLLVLHMVLVLRRLGRLDSEEGRVLGQRLFDAFCADLDGNLREMGVGDLAVPKRMRQFAEAFYGRQAAYLAALDASEPQAFEKALARNIFQEVGAGEKSGCLANYARAAVRELDLQDDSALIRGKVAFPSAEAFIHERT
jgi:cytochrome b pre-mRNA-processing protein 3